MSCSYMMPFCSIYFQANLADSLIRSVSRRNALCKGNGGRRLIDWRIVLHVPQCLVTLACKDTLLRIT